MEKEEPRVEEEGSRVEGEGSGVEGERSGCVCEYVCYNLCVLMCQF